MVAPDPTSNTSLEMLMEKEKARLRKSHKLGDTNSVVSRRSVSTDPSGGYSSDSGLKGKLKKLRDQSKSPSNRRPQSDASSLMGYSTQSTPTTTTSSTSGYSSDSGLKDKVNKLRNRVKFPSSPKRAKESKSYSQLDDDDEAEDFGAPLLTRVESDTAGDSGYGSDSGLKDKIKRLRIRMKTYRQPSRSSITSEGLDSTTKSESLATAAAAGIDTDTTPSGYGSDSGLKDKIKKLRNKIKRPSVSPRSKPRSTSSAFDLDSSSKEVTGYSSDSGMKEKIKKLRTRLKKNSPGKKAEKRASTGDVKQNGTNSPNKSQLSSVDVDTTADDAAPLSGGYGSDSGLKGKVRKIRIRKAKPSSPPKQPTKPSSSKKDDDEEPLADDETTMPLSGGYGSDSGLKQKVKKLRKKGKKARRNSSSSEFSDCSIDETVRNSQKEKRRRSRLTNTASPRGGSIETDDESACSNWDLAPPSPTSSVSPGSHHRKRASISSKKKKGTLSPSPSLTPQSVCSTSDLSVTSCPNLKQHSLPELPRRNSKSSAKGQKKRNSKNLGQNSESAESSSTAREKELEKKLKRMQSQFDELQDNHVSLQGKFRAKKLECDTFQSSLEDLQSRMAKLQTEHGSLKDSMQIKQSKQNQLLSSKDKEIRALSKTVDNILEMDRSTTSIGSFGTAHSSSLQSKLDMAMHHIATLEGVVADMERENNRLQKQMCTSPRSPSSSGQNHRFHADPESRLKNEVRDLNDDLQRKNGIISTLVNQLKRLRHSSLDLDSNHSRTPKHGHGAPPMIRGSSLYGLDAESTHSSLSVTSATLSTTSSVTASQNAMFPKRLPALSSRRSTSHGTLSGRWNP